MVTTKCLLYGICESQFLRVKSGVGFISKRAQEVLCGIEALYTPHVRNVYIQVIRVLSAAGEAFVMLGCVVS